MTSFEPKLPPPEPIEEGSSLRGSTRDSGGDGAAVRSPAKDGADGDLYPEQRPESATPDLKSSDN